MMEKATYPFWIGSLRSKRLLGLISAWKKQKAEGIVYKLINDMLSLPTWETVKKRLYQIYSPFETKVHAATLTHSRS